MNGRFLPLILALSFLNFGVDLIAAGALDLSWQDLAIMTGSWMALAGVGILVWMATRRNGNGHNGKA